MTIRFVLDGAQHEVPRPMKTPAAIYSARETLTNRKSEVTEAPRGMFCGIGCCFECLVTVNGTPKVRGCLVQVEDGMVIETGTGTAGTGTAASNGRNE